MSHYDDQREAIDDQRAATAEAERDRLLNRAIDVATPSSLRAILVAIASAAERIATAVERMVPAEIHGAPDAPMQFTPKALAEIYGNTAISANLRSVSREEAARHEQRDLIKAIESLSWFGCTHRHDVTTDMLVMSVTAERVKFDLLAKLLDLTPSDLRDKLACFDGYTRHPNHYFVRFPADWVRSA